MAGDGQPLAAPVRTVAAARLAAPARQAGARLRTVPGRLLETRRGAAPVRRPLMACAGVPRGTRAAVVRRRARVTGPAGRHVRPPQTDHAGTAGQGGTPGPGVSGRATAAPRSGSIGAAGPRRLARAVCVEDQPGSDERASIRSPGPRTTAGFVLRPAVLDQKAHQNSSDRNLQARRAGPASCQSDSVPTRGPAKAPVAARHQAASLAVRRREASAAPPSRVATPVVLGGQPTPGHGGPPRGTHGEARGLRAALPGPRSALKGAGEIRTARARGQRAKGPPLVTAAVTGHHGQPAAGLATPGQVTCAQGDGRAGAPGPVRR